MKRLLLLVSLIASLCFNESFGTHVNGYYRKDGTYVNGYERGGSSSSSSTAVRSAPPSSYKNSSSSVSSAPRITTTPSYAPHYSNYSTSVSGVQRDAHGKIKRSEAAKKSFEKMTGYPNGRPGYIVDHVIALKRGGADAPNNMQWQTKADAKAKDKWE